ncbi:hypothetical protein [Streptomyces atratus]
MRAQSAVEIARASLALAFPAATDEGLTRAAELIVRWGSEGVGVQLEPALAERMLLDLMDITGQDLESFPRLEYGDVRPSDTRVWHRSEGTRIPRRGIQPPPPPPSPAA